MFNVIDKKVIVTGGSRSLGLGITKAYLSQGAEVVMIASSDKVFEVARDFKLQGFSKIHAVKADLSIRAEVEESFEKSLDLLGGKLDVLVNNAGMIRRKSSVEHSQDDWDSVINLNLNSLFQMCQLAGKVMIPEKSGKIINIASMLSFFGGQNVPSYAASKGAVAQLTKALSNEWAIHNINVNAIAPGYMDTDLNVALVNDEIRNKEITGRIPMGRWGTPEDMGGLAIFLGSSASDYICGTVIPVDGGYLVK